MSSIPLWDIYEIRSAEPAHGVMLRGRIRKHALALDVACLVENATDEENVVRFAVLAGTSADEIRSEAEALLPSARITLVLSAIPNPVLSKLKVNDEARYA